MLSKVLEAFFKKKLQVLIKRGSSLPARNEFSWVSELVLPFVFSLAFGKALDGHNTTSFFFRRTT